MKKLLFTLACTLCLTSGFAQKPDVAIGKATYELTHIRDTANREKPYKETMVLLLGRNASVYRSVTKQLQDEMLSSQIASQVKNATDPNHLNLTITGGGAVTNEEFYQYANTKKLYTEQQIVNYYLVEEALPVINWKIGTDTLSFGTLHCQKATGIFKGRVYEAWFCPELPFRNGPWKLNGLPGLIVEVADTKREVIFKFAGFEDISNTNQTILPPAADIKTTVKDLQRLQEARAKDPVGFPKASNGGGGTRITGMRMGDIDPSKIQSITVNKSPTANARENNNPMELPEKK
ncbi:GLPGLI family protein [Mucilaginibacter sp. ZT4R22]|uniref:GLPGLI family protein n=1 Tax=Mucilaginibacter pankratovii TaxID=2772110 RepID=A0ABR7WXK6_9SPHI|nr:GLPGLI family protein [Mucilaginibacter pankratovii]MBD1367031.1 GLPGLI family protein [Mucilaginibacter pankratovii]